MLQILIKNFNKQATQNPLDKKIAATLQELENRFLGALKFLDQNHITVNGHTKTLNKLPWCLVLGAEKAGKTSLLACSQVDFTLKRQLPIKGGTVPPSEHCDWWVTRETTFIDIPGKYFSTPISLKNKRPFGHSILWLSLLCLIKQHRGNKGAQSLMLVLSLPEIMQQLDEKNSLLFRNLSYQLQDYQKIFPEPISCHIIISKCDLLPGFIEFFAESSKEELAQPWGVHCAPNSSQAIAKTCSQQFNFLIKKINDQLIRRLHQERDITARALIKDFPLHLEQLKIAVTDFIKKLEHAHLRFNIENINLTSTLQPEIEEKKEGQTEAMDHDSRAMQLFIPPIKESKPYFTKQLLTKKLACHTTTEKSHLKPSLIQYASFASSISLITVASLSLGQDYQFGIQKLHATQSHLARYKVTETHAQDPDEKLANIINLLNSLNTQLKTPSNQINLLHPVSFYSEKAQKNTSTAYQNALYALLLPEIKTYFEYYLQNPVNKNADDIYAVLKAYLMLGDTSHLDADYIISVLPLIKQNPETLEALKIHMLQAFKSPWHGILLDNNTIERTRHFLNALPITKLAYILLKHQTHARDAAEIKLVPDRSTIFSNAEPLFISKMFTKEAFTFIYSEQIPQMVNEIISGTNWVLGHYPVSLIALQSSAGLVDELRITYVNNYIDVWESILNKIHLTEPDNLAKMDEMLVVLMSPGSPLLTLLQTFHDNIFFAPIVTVDTKLGNLASLVENNNEAQAKLYQIFSCFQSLHLYLQNILIATDSKKAAFNIASQRMLNNGAPDAIAQLRMVASNSPEPLKGWLEKLANNAWHNLMQEAGHYLDTSWQTRVLPYFQTHLANHYPFNPNVGNEVNIQKFYAFFGKTGIMPTFYRQYLDAFIDKTKSPWQWKQLENQKLAVSLHTLAQIQHAMQLHVLFFPGEDDKINEKYALQLRKLNYKKVTQNKNFFALNLEPFYLQRENYA